MAGNPKEKKGAHIILTGPQEPLEWLSYNFDFYKNGFLFSGGIIWCFFFFFALPFFSSTYVQKLRKFFYLICWYTFLCEKLLSGRIQSFLYLLFFFSLHSISTFLCYFVNEKLNSFDSIFNLPRPGYPFLASRMLWQLFRAGAGAIKIENWKSMSEREKKWREKCWKMKSRGKKVAYLMVVCGLCKHTVDRGQNVYKVWGRTLTCVGVRWIILARCSRSGADRYFCILNLFSNSYTCEEKKM